MKKTIIILIMLSQTAFNFLQSQWTQIATIGNNELRGVKFFNEFTGIVVGQGGIWRSTNSGVNWTHVLSGVNLNSLSFPDINTGFAVGDTGKIYKTSNGGINWNQIGAGLTTKKLKGVSFPVSNTGWIVGESGKILYTFNGGISFVNQTINDTIQDINYIQMINASSGYLCGSSNAETFAYTPNGGINWLYTLYMSGNNLNAVSSIPISNDNALAVGSNGRIRRTMSNGTTWTVISSPINVQLNHVVFIDDYTGYIVGNSGYILKTINSGFNWTIDAIVTSNNLWALSFINSTTAWAIGSNGVVIRQGIPVGITQTVNEEPQVFILKQNYPNPFNPSTSINFELSKNSNIQLTIYDLLGDEIETLIDKEMPLGNYTILYNAKNLASGIYIYKLEINDNPEFSKCKKMLLLK